MVEPARSLEPDVFVERRASRRSRVTCDAALETLTGQYVGKLWDISEHGARLQLLVAPEAGATARLRWAGNDALCRVVWSDQDMCGIAFDNPLAETTVSETAELNRVVDLPIARVGNIALGRKRSAALSLVPLAPVADPEPTSAQLVVAFPAASQVRGAGRERTMPAALAMFLYGAPLAHVVAYQAAANPSGA